MTRHKLTYKHLHKNNNFKAPRDLRTRVRARSNRADTNARHCSIPHSAHSPRAHCMRCSHKCGDLVAAAADRESSFARTEPSECDHDAISEGRKYLNCFCEMTTSVQKCGSFSAIQGRQHRNSLMSSLNQLDDFLMLV